MKNVENKVIDLLIEMLDAIDAVEKTEDKRKIISWFHGTVGHAIPLLASYTGAKGDTQAEAKTGIEVQLNALRKTIGLVK